jgi:hypothetical protein
MLLANCKQYGQINKYFIKECIDKALKENEKIFDVIPIELPPDGRIYEGNELFFEQAELQNQVPMMYNAFRLLRDENEKAYQELCILIPKKMLNSQELYVVMSCIQELDVIKYISILDLIYEVNKNDPHFSKYFLPFCIKILDMVLLVFQYWKISIK